MGTFPVRDRRRTPNKAGVIAGVSTGGSVPSDLEPDGSAAGVIPQSAVHSVLGHPWRTRQRQNEIPPPSGVLLDPPWIDLRLGPDG